MKASAKSCWELSGIKRSRGECIWFHGVEKNEEYRVSGFAEDREIIGYRT
jgi:hypothetical protein